MVGGVLGGWGVRGSGECSVWGVKGSCSWGVWKGLGVQGDWGGVFEGSRVGNSFSKKCMPNAN